MKKLTYLLTAGILFVVLSTVGCKKDDGGGLSEEEQQIAALTGTWVASSVNDGTTDRTDYDGFTLTITKAMSYTTAGGPDLLPMPTDASFEFGDNVKTQIIIEPTGVNIPVSYSISSDGTQLTWNFSYTGDGFPNARANSVEGNWTFIFTKQ